MGGEDDFGVGGRLCEVEEGDEVLEVPILDDNFVIRARAFIAEN